MGFGEFRAESTSAEQIDWGEPVSNNGTTPQSEKQSQRSSESSKSEAISIPTEECVCDLVLLTFEDLLYLDENSDLIQIGGDNSTNLDNTTTSDNSATDNLEELESDTVAAILQEVELEGKEEGVNPTTSDTDTTTGPTPSQLFGRHDLAYPTTTGLLLQETSPLSTITLDPVTFAGLGVNLHSGSYSWGGNAVDPPTNRVYFNFAPVLSPEGSQQSLSTFSELEELQEIPEESLEEVLPLQKQSVGPRTKTPRKYRPHNSNEIAKITVEGIPISDEAWAKAYMEMIEGVSKSANVLFDHLFSDVEVMTSTKSGRGGTKVLNPDKLKAITVSVTWMFNNHHQDGLNPYHFRIEDVGTLDEKEASAVEKVFVERRNERKRKLKNLQALQTTGRRPKVSSSRGGRPKKKGGLSTLEELSPGESSSASSSSNSFSKEIQNIVQKLGKDSPPRKDNSEKDKPGCSKRSRI